MNSSPLPRVRSDRSGRRLHGLRRGWSALLVAVLSLLGIGLAALPAAADGTTFTLDGLYLSGCSDLPPVFGTALGNTDCWFTSPFTVNAGDTLTVADMNVFSRLGDGGGATVGGTLNVGVQDFHPSLVYNLTSVLDTGRVNVAGVSFLFFQQPFSNAGIIRLADEGHFVTGDDARVVNTGVIALADASSISVNNSPLDNQGLIVAGCGASITDDSHLISGNPVRYCQPPKVALTPDRAANGAGWYSAPVTFTGGADEPVSCDAPVRYSGPDTTSAPVSLSCTDLVNATATGSATVKYDATPPAITAITGGPASGSSYDAGFVPAAPTCTATDATSGVTAAGCTVTGYSAAAGPHTLIFTATDVAGNTTTQTRSYTVTPFTPAAITGTPPAATAGTAYSYAFTVAGSPAPAVTLDSGTLPAGLSLSSSGVLSGTPTTAGSSTFTVKAINGHDPATRTVTVVVGAGAPATVTSTGGDSQVGTAGQPFDTPLTVQVADANGNPAPGQTVTFTVTSGKATFKTGGLTATATTGTSGTATAPALIAGTTAGPVTITATTGSATPATFNETIASVGTARADLQVSISAPASAARGGTFTATVTVKNTGPNTASTLQTVLGLGRGLTAVTAAGGTIRPGAVIYTATGLPVSGSLTYTVTLKAATAKNAYPSGLAASSLSIVRDPKLTNNLTATRITIT